MAPEDQRIIEEKELDFFPRKRKGLGKGSRYQAQTFSLYSLRVDPSIILYWQTARSKKE